MNANPHSPLYAKPDAFTPARRGILQRKCACGGKAPAGEECEECRRKKLQRRATGPQPEEVPPIVHRVLHSQGDALDFSTRTSLEERFGHSFADVRVHTGAEASQSANAVNAEAYTVGHQIVFNSGRYAPHTFAGRQLLGHELTHVVQQRGASFAGPLTIGEASGEFETQAERSEKALDQAKDSAPPIRPAQQAVLARQPAPQLRPTVPPPPPAAARPTLTLIEGGLPAAERELARRSAQTAAAQAARRAGWRQFWQVVVRRFALRGATAAGLAAVDGPLPVGDLIALGLTLWMIWELVEAWDTIWREAEQETATRTQPESNPAPSPQPVPLPAPQQAPKEDRRKSCMERNPGAQFCDEPLNTSDDARDEMVVEFLMNQGFSYDDLGDCYPFGQSIPGGVIDDCGGAPAIRFHCRVNGDTREVSIFGCLCCDRNGATHYQWSRPHWSTNLSRRGGR